MHDYKFLKSFHRANHSLYEDAEFPEKEKRANFEWKRPNELVPSPLFFSNNNNTDISIAKQYHKEGNWGGIIAAIINLKLHQHYFANVVPADQDFDQGIFYFKFWKCGEWIEIVIDDCLPIKKEQLAFLQSEKEDEFGLILLIKAYAKFYESYDALKGIPAAIAMEDFTGGISEIIDLKSETNKDELYDYLWKSTQRGVMMTCSFKKRMFYSKTYPKCRDIVAGHSYCVTDVKTIHIEILSFKMIKLRSQHTKVPWDGPWSPDSPEHKYFVSTFSVPSGMGSGYDHPNEFWVTFDYFTTVFDSLEMCHLNSKDDPHKWILNQIESKWVPGISAGGGFDKIEKFIINPQYVIVLEEKSTVIISLMQKYEKPNNLEELNIGFTFFEISQEETHKNSSVKEFFEGKKPQLDPIYTDLREISLHFSLDAGRYLIVPSTEKAFKYGEFLLRIFSQEQNHLYEHYNQVSDIDNADSDDKFYDAVDEVNMTANSFKNILEQIITKNEFGELSGVL